MKLEEFINYLNENVDRAIYVWGAQGQKASENWIKTKEKEAGHREAALNLYKQRKKMGVNPIYAYDCSGLGMAFLFNQKRIYSGDLNANGMKGKCAIIKVNQLKKGDWVFRCYKSGANKGRAYHIGYVVDDALNVVHAKGRAYGVIKEKFSKSYWNVYGRPKIFASEIDSGEWHVKRTLKIGVNGVDVLGLQERLIEAGYKFPRYGADGDFGKETEDAVKAYQQANGLTVNGKVTMTMVKRLGGKWK